MHNYWKFFYVHMSSRCILKCVVYVSSGLCGDAADFADSPRISGQVENGDKCCGGLFLFFTKDSVICSIFFNVIIHNMYMDINLC